MPMQVEFNYTSVDKENTSFWKYDLGGEAFVSKQLILIQIIGDRQQRGFC